MSFMGFSSHPGGTIATGDTYGVTRPAKYLHFFLSKCRLGKPYPKASGARHRDGIDRQLRLESPLEGRPRFAAGDIGSQIGILIQNA